jgi:hypothetical protein
MSCCRTAGKPQNQPPSPDLPLVPADAPAVGSYGSAGRVHLVKVVEEEHEELLGACWQRGHQRRTTNMGRVLTEASDVGTKSWRGKSQPNGKHYA